MPASSPNRGRLPGYCLPIALALAVGLGCAGREVQRVPDELIGKPWMNVDGSPPARDGDTDAVTGLSALLAGQQPQPQATGKPLNVLVMSGGGKYGAFTAGILSGWTASGTRPTFDIATGVSSGALIATLAFLGPQYDQQMAEYFTTLQRSNVYQWRIVRGLLSRRGIMTADPLKKVLRGAINEQFLCDLRAAHSQGRRLYIGTSETLSNRVAVWDIGAIACSGRPDVRELLVNLYAAACSPAGVVQPIEISVEVNGVRYTEMHSDGGNTLQAFVRAPAGIPPGSNFWVLSAGKYYRSPLDEQPRILNLVASAVSNSLYALFRADLVKLYALTAVTRSNFRLIALPQDFKVSSSAFAFAPEELVRLYWVGYQMTAASGGEWRNTPPDTLPGEAAPPRTGTVYGSP